MKKLIFIVFIFVGIIQGQSYYNSSNRGAEIDSSVGGNFGSKNIVTSGKVIIGDGTDYHTPPYFSIQNYDSLVSPGWWGQMRLFQRSVDIPEARVGGLVANIEFKQIGSNRTYADWEYTAGILSKTDFTLNNVNQTSSYWGAGYVTEMNTYSTKNMLAYYGLRLYGVQINGAGNLINYYGVSVTAPVHTSSGRITNQYSFYSNSSATVTGDAYHFYGNGNYPSYFGGSVNANSGFCYFTDAQVSDAYVLTIKGIGSYIVGMEITFKANTANTDGATVNVNSLGAKALTKASAGAINTALATGDILAGQIIKAVYDGTQFQVISRLAQ